METIFEKFVQNSMEYTRKKDTKCYAKNPKKATILQCESSKFSVVCHEDLIQMLKLMREKRNGNFDKNSNRYQYWFTESKPKTVTNIMYKANKSKAQQYQLKNMNLTKKIRRLEKTIADLNKSLKNKCKECKENELCIIELKHQQQKNICALEQKQQETINSLLEQLQTETYNFVWCLIDTDIEQESQIYLA